MLFYAFLDCSNICQTCGLVVCSQIVYKTAGNLIEHECKGVGEVGVGGLINERNICEQTIRLTAWTLKR